jgi:nucleoside-diphosphate-sugar epimerase
MKFLVTGASGFIGGHLVHHLLDAGHAVRAACSAPESAGLLRTLASGFRTLEVIRVERPGLNPVCWQAACQDVEVIFHLAGRAHRADLSSSGALDVYRRDNLAVTQALASAAISAGVRRFILASSATVYGRHSPAGQPFRENSPVAPHERDPYAISKREAEIFLQTPPIRSRLAPTLVRLPLVYGAGVKGNLRALMRLIARRLPLPLAGIDNRRSFIGIANLVDFLRHAAQDERAGDRILLASDNEDVSTPELVRAIARGLGKKARLFNIPSRILRAASFMSGQGARYEKLAASFQIDAAWSRDLLDWQPRTGFAEGMARMCAAEADFLSRPG